MTVLIPHMRVASAAASDRVIHVNRQAFSLFARLGIQPPESGQFDPAALDETLDKSGATTSERMEAKSHLRHAGLLIPGRYIDDGKL